MKRLIASLALAAILAASLGVAAHAAPETRREDDVKRICMEDKRVKDAVCVFFGNTLAVALRCETVYFTNDLNALKVGAIQRIRAAYPEVEKLYVKCDLDLFLKVKKIDDKLRDGASLLQLKDEILEVLRLAEKRS